MRTQFPVLLIKITVLPNLTEPGIEKARKIYIPHVF